MGAPIGNKHALKPFKVLNTKLADTRHVPVFYWCENGHKSFDGSLIGCPQCHSIIIK